MHDAAREVMARDAATGFAEFDYDSNWLVSLAIYAEACGLLGDTGPAGALSALLEPWIGQIAFDSATAWGAVSRHVGLLKRVLGELEERRAAADGGRRLHEAGGLRSGSRAPGSTSPSFCSIGRTIPTAPAHGACSSRRSPPRGNSGCMGIERRAAGLLSQVGGSEASVGSVSS